MCHKFTAYGLSSKNNVLGYRVMALPCKSWACPECAKQKARDNAIKARKGFQGAQTRFATLTVDGDEKTSLQLKRLKASWNRLRTALTRGGKKLKYCWVLEAGNRNARPHLHVLLDRYINVRKLSAMAHHAGFGRIVDIRMVKDSGAFNYVTKYLSKGLGSKIVERELKIQHGRRIGFSRGFVIVEKKEKTFFATRIDRKIVSMDEIKKTIKAFTCRTAHHFEVSESKPWMIEVSSNVPMNADKVRHLAQGFLYGFLDNAELDLIFGGHGPGHEETEWLEANCAS